jgi:benzodiazapine receptor
MNRISNIDKRVFIYALAVFGAGYGGSLLTTDGLLSDKYVNATKPENYPANKVFGLVWTALYVLYVYAWYQVRNIEAVQPLFWANIVLNFLWIWTFFGQQDWEQALSILYILDLVLILQVYSLWNVNRKSAYALIPYLLWALFATYLNKEFIRLNLQTAKCSECC